MTSAVDVLQRSKLSPQRELLADDLSIDDLYIWQAGRKSSVDLASRLVGNPTVERTIDGASTVTVQVSDNGRGLLTSGLISKKCDIEIDGLWFRLCQVNLPDAFTDELIFEDREIAVLREYPKPGTAHNGFKVWNPTKTSRLQVASWLVAEPGRAHELDIGFVAPGYGLGDPGGQNPDGSPDATAVRNRAPGFGPNPNVTVKGVPATRAQLNVINAILTVGVKQKMPRDVLVMAIMVATAESGCGSDVGHDPKAVGVFQQNPAYWPATGNAAKDAGGIPGKHGFFEVANGIYQNSWLPSLARMCSIVQGNAGGAATYQPWQKEAARTVTAWAGSEPLSANVGGGNVTVLASGGHPFTRGKKQAVNGRVIYTREDNWTCLQRLAKEVDWRCFCVSGQIYFCTDDDLIHSAPIHTLSEKLDWVDQISGQLAENIKPKRNAFVVKKSYAQMTVNCRIHRWQAPPGTCVEVEDLGPFDGRWIVTDIQRPLANNNGVITIKKPQPALPEDLSPELRQTTAQVYVPSGSGDGSSYVADGTAIVDAAVKAHRFSIDYMYGQQRPMPSSLFAKTAPIVLDCSSFVTLAYKAANMDDPNDLNYDGQGDTLTLWNNGKPTKKPQPGDLIFWTTDPSGVPVGGDASHVAVFIGGDSGGEYVDCHGPTGNRDPIGLFKTSQNWGLPLAGYRTYPQKKPKKTKK